MDAIFGTHSATMVRAEYVVADAAAAIEHNIEVHARMAKAIIASDQPALAQALVDHRTDLVRLTEPFRSPRTGVR